MTDKIRPVPVPPPLSIELAELRHELENERHDQIMDAHRRAHIHMMWLGAGGTLSVVLYLLRLDVASLAATGAAPLLAEATVMLRKSL